MNRNTAIEFIARGNILKGAELLNFIEEFRRASKERY